MGIGHGIEDIAWPARFGRVVLTSGMTLELCRDSTHGMHCLVNQGPSPGCWAMGDMSLVEIEGEVNAIRVRECEFDGHDPRTWYIMLPSGIVQWEPEMGPC